MENPHKYPGIVGGVGISLLVPFALCAIPEFRVPNRSREQGSGLTKVASLPFFGCAPLRPAAVSRPARLRGSHRPRPGLNERGSRLWAPSRLRLAREPRGCRLTGPMDFLGFCANRPAVARRRRAATQRCAACRSWSVVGAGGAWRAVRVARGTRGLLRRGHFRRDIARLARARWVAAAVRGVGGALLPSEVAVITFPPGCGASADPRGRRALRGGGCREARSRAAVFGTGEVVRRGPARHNH